MEHPDFVSISDTSVEYNRIYKLVVNNIKFEATNWPSNKPTTIRFKDWLNDILGEPATPYMEYKLTRGKHDRLYKSEIPISRFDNISMPTTYLVGGCIRDVITGYAQHIKDVDIVTENLGMFSNNPPQQLTYEIRKSNRSVALRPYHPRGEWQSTDVSLDIWQLDKSFGCESNGNITIYDLLNRFDFNCNMAAFCVNTNTLIVHKSFLKFVEDGIVVRNHLQFGVDNLSYTSDQRQILEAKLTKFKSRFTISDGLEAELCNILSHKILTEQF